MNWREKIEAQIAEATEHGDPLDMVYIEVHAPVLQALLDDRKRLRAALESCRAERKVCLEYGALRDEDNNRLRAALSRYGEHAPGCSSRDVMDCGRSFVRADWPCDCGFREALQEGE